MKNILIIEDEENLALLLQQHLQSENFHVEKSHCGKEGLNIFFSKKIDLILLDINLPDIQGWDIYKKIRETSQTPIVMMTARDSEIDQLQGLELGAEDYITKPFSLKVLTLKLKKILKTSSFAIYQNRELTFDFKNLSLSIKDENIELTKKQLLLLEYLIRNRGVTMSREQLLNEIWGYDYFGDDRIVDTLVKRVRERMGDYGSFIKTMRGIGYCFNDKN
ncbi:MAG: response regulator transcription factor [Fusobacteriaceae bacterium]